MVIQNPKFPVPVLYLSGYFLLTTASFMVVAQSSTTVPVNVGVVMDMNSWVGKMGLSCIDMSLSDFYSSNPHFITRIVLHHRDSQNDVVGAAAAALDLIKNSKVQALLGPKSSMQANFVIEMGEKAHVPIVTFTATSPSLASLRSPYFFRVGQNDSSQVDAISAIVKHFGWRQVVPVYQDDDFGEGILPSLIDSLQDVDSQVPYRSVINPAASNDHIGEELYKLKTLPTRVFVVHMVPKLAARLLVKAKEIGMMDEGYVWILTDATANQLTSMDSSVLNAMHGALGVKTYVPRSKELESFKIRWKRKFLQDNPVLGDPQLDVFGLWAYDAARALAMAVENIGTTNFTVGQNPNPSNNLTDLETLGVSQNGQRIRDSLSNTKFRGLSGDFSIVNGQLQSSNFEIMNVNSNGVRVVGFWTPANGLTKDFKRPGTRHINWPGDSTSTPQGWEIPTNGKRLRVGVPVKDGYSEFVKVYPNGTVTGFCIDVFDAVIKTLSYDLRFDYIPDSLPDGSSAGSYDDLIMKVHNGTYDAVVGDVAIVAKRSLYVDFSLPFTESGVCMVVPVKNNSKNKAWVFLKPLTWDLWATSFCFFVFMGFVVWVLEHRINEDFRGPPSHQIGTSLWFSFCTMVFAQRETVVSNMARFVVVIWFFVVLILTQSYTASLTSLLTVQQLQPTVTDVDQIIKSNMTVGYQDGSFVYDLLKTTLGLKNLKSFGSPEELHKLFKLGTSNGGIDAAFDEIPYLKVFLYKYSDKYTVTEPNYRTDGFGFVFPIGSPLLGYISRAVLNVTQSKIMNEIQQKWLWNERNTQSSNSEVSSSRLGLSSFWGLFLIAGSAAAVALLIYLFIFLRKEKHNIDSDTSTWKKFMVLLKIYDGRDLTSHTFKRSHLTNRSGFGINGDQDGSNAVSFEASPRSQYPPSPSMESVRDQSFEFFNGGSSPRNEASPDVAAVVELGPINEESVAENK